MVNGCYLCKKIAELCKSCFSMVPDCIETMVYCLRLFGINWVVADSGRDEIWTCKDISGQRKNVELIPPTIFRII